MLADLGVLFFWQMFLQLFPWIQASLLLFFPLHFLLVPAPMETPCALIVQCAIPRETPRFNNVIRV